MLNFDREKDGYLEGLRQARAGGRKEYRTKGLVKAAAMPFEHSFRSYMKGLDRGYAEGLKEMNITQKVTNTSPNADQILKSPITNSNTMRDSIGYQIEALENLRNFLDKLSGTLGEAAQQYDRFVTEVGNSGMVERIVQRYEDEFMAPNLNHIRSLRNRIQSEDIPYIIRESQQLEGLGRQ